MDQTTRFVMRADAIFDLCFGVLMFFAPFVRGLFNWLDLPNPQPEIFTQIAGGLLVGFAYLLWIAVYDEDFARHIALVVGLVNAVGVLVIAGWLFRDDLGVDTLGTLILLGAAVILAIFSLIELRYVSKDGL